MTSSICCFAVLLLVYGTIDPSINTNYFASLLVHFDDIEAADIVFDKTLGTMKEVKAKSALLGELEFEARKKTLKLELWHDRRTRLQALELMNMYYRLLPQMEQRAAARIVDIAQAAAGIKIARPPFILTQEQKAQWIHCLFEALTRININEIDASQREQAIEWIDYLSESPIQLKSTTWKCFEQMTLLYGNPVQVARCERSEEMNKLKALSIGPLQLLNQANANVNPYLQQLDRQYSDDELIPLKQAVEFQLQRARALKWIE